MIPQTFKTTIATLCLISCAALLAHAGGLMSPFIYDDVPTIVQNTHIRELDRFQEKVGIENILNRSMTLLTYAVNFELGGIKVFGYHLLNILVHILTSITLFYTTRQLLKLETSRKFYQQNRLPHWVATLYTIHPITTQSVTYLSNRSSILAAFFSLLAFYIFIQFVENHKAHRSLSEKICFSILILISFLSGCASKATAVVFPILAVMFLILRYPNNLKSFLPTLILILLPLGIYLIYRAWRLGSPFHLHAEPAHGQITSFTFFLTQIRVVVFYYGQKLLWPFNLSFEPDIHVISNLLDTAWVIPSLILLTIGWMVYHSPSKIIQFGFLWTLITIVPTSSFIPLNQLASEHRLYLPSQGFVMALSASFSIPSLWRKPSRYLFLVFLCLFIINAAHRQLDYRSSIHLWQDTIQKSPKKPFLYNNLAIKLLEADRLDEAETMLYRAIEMDPMSLLPQTNLGNIYYKKGLIQEAQKKFDTVLNYGSRKPTTYYNSGLTRFELGNFEEALLFFQKASQLDPDFAPYHYSLGNTYKKLQRYDEALTEYKLTLKYDPKHLASMNNRGVIFLALNQTTLAEKEFQNVLDFDKNHLSALNNLAGIRLIQGRHREALLFMDRYLNLNPENIQVQEARRATQFILKMQVSK